MRSRQGLGGWLACLVGGVALAASAFGGPARGVAVAPVSLDWPSAPLSAISLPPRAAPATPVVAVTVPTPALPPASAAVAFALAQVGKPYRFGAAGPTAFDCSGLTRAAYLAAGTDLPHYATAQAARGRAVEWRSASLAPGDLVFTRGGRPRHDLGHVGLAVSATEWVVAPAPGLSVQRAPIPFDRVQAVRRLAG